MEDIVLKVLYLPIGSQPGTCDGFKNAGVDLDVYSFTNEAERISKSEVNARFIQRAKRFKPDLIHMQLQMTSIITPDTLTKIRKELPNVVMTNWTGDIRTTPSNYFISISKVVDYSLLSHVGQIPMYKAAGCHNPRYWQIGFDPKIYYPQKKKDFKYDVVFAGSSYKIFPDSKLRLEIMRQLKQKFGQRFGLFGNGYPSSMKASYVPIEKINDVYNDSRCVLSVSNFNDVSHYFSDRLLMCLASGRPTIMYRFPSYDSYFGHMNDILLANNIDEIISMVEFCKQNPDEADRVGTNGYLKVLSEHSFTSRVIELLSFTGMIGKI